MTNAERDKLLAQFDAELDTELELVTVDTETGEVTVSEVYELPVGDMVDMDPIE